MKIIKIFQEDNETIELFDNDNTDRTEYIQQLKNLIKSNDIMILETSSSSVILRPHKIEAILVIDDSELVGEEEIKDNISDSEESIRG